MHISWQSSVHETCSRFVWLARSFESSFVHQCSICWWKWLFNLCRNFLSTKKESPSLNMIKEAETTICQFGVFFFALSIFSICSYSKRMKVSKVNQYHFGPPIFLWRIYTEAIIIIIKKLQIFYICSRMRANGRTYMSSSHTDYRKYRATHSGCVLWNVCFAKG